MAEVLIPGLVMLGLGVTLSVVLVVANKTLYVYEDPRIDAVEEMLPSANCGACGMAGCRAFAEAVVKGEAAPGHCTVNEAGAIKAIADYLGVDAGGKEKRVARLACAGGTQVAWTRAQYEGAGSCRSAALIAGGGKGCFWGCLGLGECAEVCNFDAITMNEFGLPVVNEDRCTACGDCVEVCPKDLFSIQPVSNRLWVACRSLAAGEQAEAECEVACTGCGRCAMDAAQGLITIENNLARVDYSRNGAAKQDAIQRCPTGAIVWIDEKKGTIKGVEAKKVTRKTPLPMGEVHYLDNVRS